MPTPVIRNARPTFLVKGKEVQALSADLLHLQIEENLEGMCRAEASFVNWGPREQGTGYLHFSPDSALDLGASLEIRSGDHSLFVGKITCLEGEFPAGNAMIALTVLAEDRLQDLRMMRRSRVFEAQSDQQILERICADHGLTLDGKVEGPTHPSIAQLNQSDLAFLRGRAGALGVDLWLEGRRLVVVTKRVDQPDIPVLSYGSELTTFRVSADLAEQCTAVVVSGWDPGNREGVEFRSTAALIAPDLKKGQRSGPAILEETFGERLTTVVHTLPRNVAIARSESEARMRGLSRKFVHGVGVTDRVLAAKVGKAIELKGLGPRFSGLYSVVATQVRFDGEEGLRMEFTVERPGLGSPA